MARKPLQVPVLPEDFDAAVGALLAVKPPPSGKKAVAKSQKAIKPATKAKTRKP